jgi:hypothetical protein
MIKAKKIIGRKRILFRADNLEFVFPGFENYRHPTQIQPFNSNEALNNTNSGDVFVPQSKIGLSNDPSTLSFASNTNFSAASSAVPTVFQFNQGNFNSATPKEIKVSYDFELNKSSDGQTGFDFTTNDLANGLDFTGSSSADTKLFFRENLAENPLVQQSATNILENSFIPTDKNTKSTIKETIDLIKGNKSFNYAQARSTAYETKNLTDPSKESYYTAVLDRHIAEDLLAGVVFKSSNKFTTELGEKYANDMEILNRSEVSARERHKAVSKSLQKTLKLGAGLDPLSILTKDIISKAGEIKVQERDAKGEIVKVDGKSKEILITLGNFERYLDDPALQKAIEKEINNRTYYQNNNYAAIIDNYRAKHPDMAPDEKVSGKSKAKLSQDTITAFKTLSSKINPLLTVKDKNILTGSGEEDKQKNKLITSKEREARKGWGDYREIKWGNSEHGTIFTQENKALINQLYAENIKEGGIDVKYLDQFTSLIVTLVNKASTGTLTNQEVTFLKKISIESDWKPDGASSKNIAREVIKVLGNSDLKWQ